MCRKRSQAMLYNLAVPITTPMMGNFRPFLGQSLWKGSWKSDDLGHRSFEISLLSLLSFPLTSLSQFSFPGARQTCRFLTQVHFWAQLLRQEPWQLMLLFGLRCEQGQFPSPTCPDRGEDSWGLLVVCKGPRCGWLWCQDGTRSLAC